jgi:methionyl-tRNA formyltransferase
MGTPEFAVPSLKKLLDENYDVCAVFTKPDKPQGRKMTITPPPVKVYAQERGIEVFQPEKLKTQETYELIKNLNPDLIIVVAYGKILPKNIIEFPKYGCINVHGSLLPKYRGAAPIQWSIINGDKLTGITTMFMDEGLDTGDILLQSKVFINDSETSEDLKKRLSDVGAELLIKTLKKLEDGTLERIKQNDNEATLSPPLDKITGNIDWENPAEEIHNLIRGSNPWPIAQTTLRGKLFKIYKSKVSTHHSAYPGKVVATNPLIIGCGKNTSLELIEVQIEGKKRMPASDFARGYRLTDKTIFGLIPTNQ